MLKIIEGGATLQEHMAGHTIPIAKYFRLSRVRSGRKDNGVKIIKESVISEHCIEVKIRMQVQRQESHYIIRFNDQPVLSTVTNIREG